MCVLVALLCVCVSARYFDLKLENILVRSTGHLSLADMGLSYPQAKLLAEAPLICGTPAYMAPEQVRCGGNGAHSLSSEAVAPLRLPRLPQPLPLRLHQQVRAVHAADRQQPRAARALPAVRPLTTAPVENLSGKKTKSGKGGGNE